MRNDACQLIWSWGHVAHVSRRVLRILVKAILDSFSQEPDNLKCFAEILQILCIFQTIQRKKGMETKMKKGSKLKANVNKGLMLDCTDTKKKVKKD